MGMHKLLENVEKELHEVESKGITTGNIDIVCKLVDIYKDLKTVEHERHEEVSGVSGMKTERSAVEAHRFDRNINELYDKYIWCKKEYAEKGADHRPKVLEAIEKLMSEIGDLLFDIHRDCDFKEERDIVLKHVKSMIDIK